MGMELRKRDDHKELEPFVEDLETNRMGEMRTRNQRGQYGWLYFAAINVSLVPTRPRAHVLRTVTPGIDSITPAIQMRRRNLRRLLRVCRIAEPVRSSPEPGASQ